MASEKPLGSALLAHQPSVRRSSPSDPQPRLRGLGRAATFADAKMSLNQRRSSLFSDGLSETRRSLRESTDNILLPRANGSAPVDEHHDHSHWQSVPLGLALLPAVGGMLFKNGSAVVTDMTLLALAAIFLNWSVRLPWYVSLSQPSRSDAHACQGLVHVCEGRCSRACHPRQDHQFNRSGRLA